VKNKRTIVAALIMIVSGAILLGIGLAAGGKTSLVWKEGRPQNFSSYFYTTDFCLR
jgi:hypothetical protein